jgi:hypothetical protein
MRVIPVSSGLVETVEIVEERVTFMQVRTVSSHLYFKRHLPGAIGHWLTKATPSAQLVPFLCSMPCQCYHNGCYNDQHRIRWSLESTYNTSGLIHGRIMQLVCNVDSELDTLGTLRSIMRRFQITIT